MVKGPRRINDHAASSYCEYPIKKEPPKDDYERLETRSKKTIPVGRHVSQITTLPLG
jgi:hypothetical protein